MTTKRKDKKGRVLRTGESQRADGRYEYKYTDPIGRRRSVYSWKLVDTDRLPEGKRGNKSLRDMEAEIQRDFMDGIDSYKAQAMTLGDCFEMRMRVVKVRKSTASNKNYLYKEHIQPRFQNIKLKAIKPAMLMEFYLNLLEEKKLAVSTVIEIHHILSSLFNFAVDNDILRKNPAIVAMRNLKNQNESLWSHAPREALTVEQHEAICHFFHVNMTKCLRERVSKTFFRKYMIVGSMVNIMLGTGLRIGELTGLTWDDCDFSDGIISVNHTLQYISIDGKTQYFIGPPKSKAGNREIAMNQGVRETLMRLRELQQKSNHPTVKIDGYSDFIFHHENGVPFSPNYVAVRLKRILKEYTSAEEELAKEENRDPILIDSISPHIFRHTFCTRLIEAGAGLEWVHIVMGHSGKDITEKNYIHLDKKMVNNKLMDMFLRMRDSVPEDA